MKKKMDFATKAKLIYSGELLLFALVFITIAILKLTNVIPFSSVRATIFNWVTIFGGTWLLVDLFWAIFDKKRQKRIAIIDKIIHSPAGVYLITFDLYCLISQIQDQKVYQIGVPIVLGYLGLCYIFEAIYHFKFPVPGLIEIEEEQKKEEEEDSSKEENQSEEQ